jgi:hypothetical protein
VRQFWLILLQRVGLPTLVPQPSESSFNEWWRHASNSVTAAVQTGLDFLIILGVTIWRHRNDCVFNGKSPHLPSALVMVADCWSWSMAGARGISQLIGHS